MWSQFGLSWAEAVGALVTTVVMYAAVLIVLRLIGPRLVNGFSAVDAAATLAVGAIVGRTALGNRVTLSDGLVALTT